MSVVEPAGPMGGGPAAPRASRAAPAAKAPSIASRPTAPGTRCGRRPTTRPTTSRSTSSGALLVATGSKGKIYRVAGDPAQTTLLARASAQQVTTHHRRPRPRRAAGDGESGQGVPPVGAPGDDRHRTSRRSATPSRWRRGARSAGAGRRRRARACGCSRVGQHADRRRHLEPVVGGLPQPRRRADHQPEGALPAVEDRAGRRRGPQPGGDLGHRRLPAAQPAPGDRRRSRFTRRASCSRSRSRPARPRSPASTPAPPDRRPGASAAQPGSGVAAARPPRVPEGPADVSLEGAGRQRRRPVVRRALPARGRDDLEGAEAQPHRADLRVGHDVGAERHLCRQDRRLRRARQPARRRAGGRAREQHVRHRQLAADHQRAERDAGPTATPSSGSRCATSTRPCSASSTRSTRTAGGRSTRRTASPIRGWKSSS